MDNSERNLNVANVTEYFILSFSLNILRTHFKKTAFCFHLEKGNQNTKYFKHYRFDFIVIVKCSAISHI